VLRVWPQGEGVVSVNKKEWLRNGVEHVLKTDDEWLNASGIAERILSYFPDRMYHWNAKSLTPILRIMVRNGQATSTIIKGRVYYRRKDEA